MPRNRVERRLLAARIRAEAAERQRVARVLRGHLFTMDLETGELMPLQSWR